MGLMRVAVAADHAGFPLKGPVSDTLRQLGHDVLDLGGDGTDPQDDYPVYSKAVALAVASGQADRAVLICGSGVGASVAANKMRGVRAALIHDTYSAHQGVEHDDINVLCLGARVIQPDLAIEIVRLYIQAQFTGEERHARRLAEIQQMEQEFCNG
jgi:ribose 5-phosphate isomerase B